MTGRYNFSRDKEGARSLSLPISKELHERIMRLCNITEMTQTAICRYLLTRGIGDMETELVELVDRKVAE